MRSDRRDHPPYGVAGAAPGGPSANILNPGTKRAQVLPTMPMAMLALRKGDVFRHVSAGGGGFGPAIEREASRCNLVSGSTHAGSGP